MNFIKKQLESIRQYSFPRTRALEQELNSVREAHTAISADLAKVRDKQQRTHEDEVRLLAELRQQVKQVKSERSHAQYQIEVLERSLAHAEQRQKFTETHVESLETKLEEERNRHEASMLATETRQAHLQAEQQSQLQQQTDLANTFHRVSTRLFESVQETNNKRRFSLLQLMIIGGLFFATGTLIGGVYLQYLRDGGQELTVLKQDIRDMRGFMKEHIDNQDALIKELSVALNSQIVTEPVVVEEESAEPKEPEALAQEEGIPPLEPVTFTPDIRELQSGLIALGFDLGLTEPSGELDIKTRQAMQEFKQFYLPYSSEAQEGDISEPLVVMILKSADLARDDAARFNIDSDVLAAIRLGSIRTGVDFSYLMELARVESNFNPTVRAPKSSATGLYQFKHDAWLETIRTFGADYGLNDYAAQVELIDNENHEQPPMVSDPLQLEVLALRLNPRLSTLMMAENIKRNLRTMSQIPGWEPGRTDLYLAHYFGADGAVVFIKALDEEPAAIAAEIFPEEAAKNPDVFQNRQHQLRSVAQVYQWLDRKFNTERYGERTSG
jgi:peptidoglycan hydrolase-like protein with peptidoglycan-binding domain